jgi:hypothetical protein
MPSITIFDHQMNPSRKPLAWPSLLSSLELLGVALDIAEGLKTLFGHLQRTTAVYEVVSYHATLELQDTYGQSAIYKKKELVRVLKDNCSSVWDDAWGDGQPFVSHRVQPGRIVKRVQVGARYRSLIALPTAKHKGELLPLEVRRRIRNGFRQSDQWWLEVAVNHPVHQLSLGVIFPGIRAVREAQVLAQRSENMVSLPVQTRPDGRQEVLYQASDVPIGECLTLQWRW